MMNSAAMFTRFDGPYGPSVQSVLDEKPCSPEMLAQLLIYWLDRQVHNGADKESRDILVRPGVIALHRFGQWTQAVSVTIKGMITPVEFGAKILKFCIKSE